MFQSTHSLRSATDDGGLCVVVARVSIHALLAECDFITSALAVLVMVSIHALLAECDSMLGFDDAPFRGFNPRTPCGVRPNTSIPIITTLWFQSTHSLRSATITIHRRINLYRVSIHALLAECDLKLTCNERDSKSFNPRTPCGVRQFRERLQKNTYQFQSTHSLRSATLKNV